MDSKNKKPQFEQQNNKKKKGLASWWHNMGSAGRIAICCLAGAAVVAAVAVPVVIAVNKNKTDSQNAEVTGTGKDLIKSVSFTKQSDGSYKGKIEIADGKSKSDIQEIVIKVGNKVLTKDTDYSISDSGDITIKAGVVTNNDNITIEVVKKDSPVTPTVTEIAVDSTGIKTHNSGDQLDLTGIKIKAHLSSGTDVDVEKSKVSFNPAEGSIINTTHDVSVTATYENVSKNFNVKVNDPIVQHTVTFKVDGQATSTQTVNDGEKVNKPNDPEKTGYTFKCWNNGADEYNFNQPVTKDLTLDAMFGATSYTITYNLDGGTNNPDNPETYTIETNTIALKDATKDEYTFSGWYDQATGGNKVTEIAKGSTGNKTLYARWTVVKVTSVTISNTSLFVGTGEEVELTATVLPENASNKKLNWEITTGSDKAEIVEKDNKTYLKGKDTTGDVTVKATSKDGSDKSDSKTFSVVPSYLEYTQVGQTDTCLVKAKSGKTLPENVVIPEKDPITSRTVVGIAPNGFSGTGLNAKTVTFEKSDNITTISYNAFLNNNSLVSFEIPKNVEVIGPAAFQFDPSKAGQTRSLTTITIETGSKLKKIGGYAFTGQTSLNSIAIPSTVEYIGSSAFCSTGLTSATFADTTTNWVFNYYEIWTPSTNATTNADKLKSLDGYYCIVKNTIAISGESSVKPQETITLSVPEGITVVGWGTSNSSIAIVDFNSGVVTGVAAGKCYIYVFAEDSEKVGIKEITVEDEKPEVTAIHPDCGTDLTKHGNDSFSVKILDQNNKNVSSSCAPSYESDKLTVKYDADNNRFNVTVAGDIDIENDTYLNFVYDNKEEIETDIHITFEARHLYVQTDSLNKVLTSNGLCIDWATDEIVEKNTVEITINYYPEEEEGSTVTLHLCAKDNSGKEIEDLGNYTFDAEGGEISFEFSKFAKTSHGQNIYICVK